MRDFRLLVRFYKAFRERPFMSLLIQNDGGTEYRFGDMIIHGMVLCREYPFQVELFQGHGPGKIPSHSHPNVDSLEVALSGDIRFMVNGALVLTKDMVKTKHDGTMAALGAIVRIDRGIEHSAVIGPKGGAFLSVQRWLNGVPPTSVAKDWEGPSFVSR